MQDQRKQIDRLLKQNAKFMERAVEIKTDMDQLIMFSGYRKLLEDMMRNSM